MNSITENNYNDMAEENEGIDEFSSEMSKSGKSCLLYILIFLLIVATLLIFKAKQNDRQAKSKRLVSESNSSLTAAGSSNCNI